MHDDLTARLARRVRALRDARGFSLDALAARSGVSRSNISLIERGESSPTAAVLDRLAAALGVTLSAIFEDAAPAAAASPVARAGAQVTWSDPGSGYVRRDLSPAVPGSTLQLVEVTFPAGRRVALDSGPRDREIQQQVWIVDGKMDVTVDGTRWRLETGDCLAMAIDGPIVFHNPGRRPARYLVALATLPPRRR